MRVAYNDFISRTLPIFNPEHHLGSVGFESPKMITEFHHDHPGHDHDHDHYYVYAVLGTCLPSQEDGARGLDLKSADTSAEMRPKYTLRVS